MNLGIWIALSATLSLWGWAEELPGVPCPSEFSKIAAASPSVFEPWSFGKPVKLRPEQVLPPEFLAKVEETLGAVRVEVSQNRNQMFFKVHAGRRKSPFMKWALVKEPQANTLEMGELRLENPLESTGGLHLSQKNKGLPFKVFLYARERLFEFARAGGFTRLVSHESQNFTVLMLYRKMVGMEGANAASSQMISTLDELYEFAKKLPEDIRPRSLDAFSRSLGDYNKTADGAEALQAKLTEIRKSGAKLPDGYTEYKNAAGQTLAIAVQAPGREERQVFYLNPQSPFPRVLQWMQINKEQHVPRLVLDI
ncbi:MAG: hypothetical protein NDJ89_03700 [Oligoflexia bacterium]|nr:hypothetical protein [Oligoflexia bacterium]